MRAWVVQSIPPHKSNMPNVFSMDLGDDSQPSDYSYGKAMTAAYLLLDFRIIMYGWNKFESWIPKEGPLSFYRNDIWYTLYVG